MEKPGSKTPYDQYKETQIKTATQGKLIVMLYEGAIKFLKVAKNAINEKNIESAHNNIVRAQDIIMELLLSLNMEAGEIAEKLHSLYLYMNKRLMEANIYKKIEPIDEVLKMLIELKDVWAQIANNTTTDNEYSLEKERSINIAT